MGSGLNVLAMATDFKERADLDYSMMSMLVFEVSLIFSSMNFEMENVRGAKINER
jgi:hypothetical protein